MSVDFAEIIGQIKGFNVTLFEMMLTPEEVDRFRVYIICYHRLANKHQRALELLKKHGIDISEL